MLSMTREEKIRILMHRDYMPWRNLMCVACMDRKSLASRYANLGCTGIRMNASLVLVKAVTANLFFLPPHICSPFLHSMHQSIFETSDPVKFTGYTYFPVPPY